MAPLPRAYQWADGFAYVNMTFGDTIRIEMLDANGKSIFGAISQQLVQAGAKTAA